MTTSEQPSWVAETQKIADNIRLRGFDYVLRNNGGYLSQICSAAEIFALLYHKVMRLGRSEAPSIPPAFTAVPSAHNPNFFSGSAYNGPRLPHLDRFIFSPAHYALPLYVTLIETGRMAPEALAAFNQDGSSVELIAAEHSPGVETTTGSLAQALSHAGGIALARKLHGDTGRVWVMMSDGEFQEGQTWEALAALAHYKLDNVAVIVDVNGQQCDGEMQHVMTIEPLEDKLRAFGASAHDVDGHDLEAMHALTSLQTENQPLFILARTNPTQGVPLLQERAPQLHYLRFSSEDDRQRYRDAYNNLVNGD